MNGFEADRLRVSGLNHVTLAVNDISRSVRFYRDVLGCRLRTEWDQGAYLEAGSLWLCLSFDVLASADPHPDYTHIAFDVSADAFEGLSDRVRLQAIIWKENRSEGRSLYVLDPDGHKLDLHVGTLESRLAHYRANPLKGRHIF